MKKGHLEIKKELINYDILCMKVLALESKVKQLEEIVRGYEK